MWMNQWEIESAARLRHACPNVCKGVKLLHALMESVNAQSDGWAHWAAPGEAADKLMDLLRTAGNVTWHNTVGTITEAQLEAAIVPIRRMVAVQREKQKRYGNTFDFDVDAAMQD